MICLKVSHVKLPCLFLPGFRAGMSHKTHPLITWLLKYPTLNSVIMRVHPFMEAAADGMSSEQKLHGYRRRFNA